MKRLIAFVFCLALLATGAQAQTPKRTVAPANKRTSLNLQEVAKRIMEATQKDAPVQINGNKRLATVTLELQQEAEDGGYTQHHYWNCPAVIFTKDGSLAFDGECWNAFEEASKLAVGPVVIFRVDFSKLGRYSTGEQAGEAFYFQSTYVDGEGDEYTHSINEAFKRSNDQSYIVYKLSLFNDPSNEGNPNNSEVKQAIANYYAQNDLKEVTAETLSKYFRQKHPTTNTELTRRPFVR